jgi:hypothetical protein
MRSALLIGLLAMTFGLGSGCASGSENTDGGGTGTGGSGGSSDGGQTCSPACGAGAVCVGSGTQGGVVIFANDAGVCPSGTHLSVGGTVPICERDLSYACRPIPAGCGGTITCPCAAATLCTSQQVCLATTDGLSCVELVP